MPDPASNGRQEPSITRSYPRPLYGTAHAALSSILTTGCVSDEHGCVFELAPISITRDGAEALIRIIMGVVPSMTIEVGLAHGVSTLAICCALDLLHGDGNTRHVVMDPHQASRYGNVGLHLLATARVQQLVEFHEERSQILLPSLLKQGSKFDLAFVDGDHRFEAVVVDLTFLDELMRPGGIVVIDDVWMPSVGQAVEHFLRNCGWQRWSSAASALFETGPNADRFAVLQTPTSRAHEAESRLHPL